MITYANIEKQETMSKSPYLPSYEESTFFQANRTLPNLRH